MRVQAVYHMDDIWIGPYGLHLHCNIVHANISRYTVSCLEPKYGFLTLCTVSLDHDRCDQFWTFFHDLMVLV